VLRAKAGGSSPRAGGSGFELKVESAHVGEPIPGLLDEFNG
jgi:hypothetical protein